MYYSLTISSLTSSRPCHHFSLDKIKYSTNDFDDKLVIGHGGFGKVYKGHICINKTSRVVAIKRLDSFSTQGEFEFRAEIEMLSKLRHPHLVSLIGYCNDNKEMILVYEYMPHGALHDHLHKDDIHLSWVQRLKVAVGAARGLHYLHEGGDTKHGIIHRDVKSSNILLDENWEAMISDFGLSKIIPVEHSFYASVKGTFGYLDPEYFYTKKLTRATDVYAFGVLLFELLSGRLPVDERYGDEHCSLVRWAKQFVKERRLEQMVDSKIKGTISPKCLRKFAQIANRCLDSVPKERPTMTEVVALLEALLDQEEKVNNLTKSPSTSGFTWNINKYKRKSASENRDQRRTSLPGDYRDYSDLELKPVGTLEVKLVQAQGLTNKDIIGETDPGSKLFNRPLRNRMKTSKVINNDLNPIWNEHFEFAVEEISTQHLTVKIYDDEQLQAADLLGCAQVQLNTLEPGKVKEVWIKLVKDLDIQRDNKDRGKVHLELLYCPYGMDYPFTNLFTNLFTPIFTMTSLEKVFGRGDTENCDLGSKNKTVIIRGVLSVAVIAAEDLPATDLLEFSNPFVVLTMKKSGTKSSTRVVNVNLNPVWNQTFGFIVEDGLHDMLVVEVYNHSRSREEYIGRCILTLTRVIMEGVYKECFVLDGTKSGKLHLNLKWMAQPIYHMILRV